MIIAITNQKGGVGKTTTAINLAAALASKGSKTLLVDLDPQANSSMSFLDIHQLQGSIYDALIDQGIPVSSILRTAEKIENLDVAPSTIALAKIEAKLIGELDSHYRLKDDLQEVVRIDFDYVVIDTPPTLGIITVNALVAATHVLIPIQASYFALEGTDDLLETIDKIKLRANPQLQILGALITMYDKRTLLAKDIYEQIQRVFGVKVFKTVITKSVRLEESPAYRESIFTFAPRSTGAYEYYRLSEEVLCPCLRSRRSVVSRCGSRCATTPISSRSSRHGDETPVGKMIPLSAIETDPRQPRSTMGDLDDLVASIRDKGVLEPILVRAFPR